MATLKEVFAQQGLAAADFLVAAAVAVYTPSATPVYITYQTLRAVAAGIDPDTAKVKIDAVAAVIAQADPIGHQLLFGIGVDVNFPDAQKLLAALPTLTKGVVTEADCDAIRDLGRSKQFQWQVWGLEQAPTQTSLDNLAQADALQALKNYVSGLTKFAYNAYLNLADSAIASDQPLGALPSFDDIRAAYDASLKGS